MQEWWNMCSPRKHLHALGIQKTVSEISISSLKTSRPQEAAHTDFNMSDSRIEAQSLDDELVATISRTLISAGVPNIMWGNYLLTVYGVPTIVDVCLRTRFSAGKIADALPGGGFHCVR